MEKQTRRIEICLLAHSLMLIPLLFAPVQVQERPIEDQDITLAIKEALRQDDRVPADRIFVSTENGIVTLTGAATNLLAKERARRHAETIRGVRSVIDLIRMMPTGRSDDEITRDISKTLLINPATQFSRITVAVTQSVATLSGSAESLAGKQLAAEIAKGVDGVKGLRNEIEILRPVERTDSEVEAKIEQRFEFDVWPAGSSP
ncbi:MAG: hypothetical protein C4293_21670 [Nitrospiraceae bacterium]